MSGSYTDLAHEDLTCPLCFEFMVDPHTPMELSCPHVYCLVCLRHMVTNGQTQIDCPECRHPTSVPLEKGVSGLRINTQLRSLAQKHLHVQNGQPKYSIERVANLTCPMCFEFLKDPHTPKALCCSHVYCSVCLKTLLDKKHNIVCPQCKQKTKVAKGCLDNLKTNLRLRSLAEKHLKSGEKKMSGDKCAGEVTCPHHKGETMPFHCSTCDEAICQFCLLRQHRKHDVKEQNQLVQEKKMQLGKILQKALRDVEGRIDKLQLFEGEIESNLKKEEEDVDRCVAKAVQMVQTTGQALKKQLRQSEQQRLLMIREEVVLLQTKMGEIKNSQRSAQKDIDVLTYESHNEQCSIVAGKLNQLRIKEPAKGFQIQTDDTETAKFVAHRKVKLGRIVEPLKLQLVQEFGEFSGANAIAASVGSDNHIIVNDFGESQVQVYTYQPYEYKHKCMLDLSKANTCQVRDVAVNVREEFLVARGTGVEVYTTDGQYKKTIATEDMDNTTQDAKTNIFSITSNQDGRILVGDMERSVVIEHRSRTNRVIRTSTNPGSIAFVGDAHMAVTDRFESGHVRIQSLSTGKESLRLDIPGTQGVCHEHKSDCVLVLRSETGDQPGLVKLGTGVLEQYCRVTGRLIGCLLRGLYHPRAVVLTSEDMLAIADQKTVKIYRINSQME